MIRPILAPLIVALLVSTGACAAREIADASETAPEPAIVTAGTRDVATPGETESDPEPKRSPSIDEVRKFMAELPPVEDDRELQRWRRDRVRMGDALLVAGDREAARAMWQEVAEPFKLDPFGSVPGEARDARIRLTFVGKSPPPIGPTEGLGGDAETWESLRGRVVVAHSFWTYCYPCRSSMLSLDAIKKRHGDAVVVIGLGAFAPFGQDGGRIPDSRDEIHDVSWVEIADRDEFREHLIAFRDVVQLSYRWLVQDGARYVRWQLPENHPILLVGRDGIVQMAVRGPNLDSLEAALEKVLAAE